MTVERIVKELATIAFCQLTEAGLIRANDKRAALVDLGKHLGMFQNNVIMNVIDGLPKRASINFGGKLTPLPGRPAGSSVL